MVSPGSLLQIPCRGNLSNYLYTSLLNVHRKIEGRISLTTLSRSRVGIYYVSLISEVAHEPTPKAGSYIGIDTGVKDLGILSNGTVYKNNKPLKTNLKKLKYEQHLTKNNNNELIRASKISFPTRT